MTNPQPNKPASELREQILAIWQKEFPPLTNSSFMPEDLLVDLTALVHQEVTKELKYIDGKLLATEPEVLATSASEDDLNAWMRGYAAAYKEVEELIGERMALLEGDE